MHPVEQAAFRQCLDVPPDCDRGDAELRREIGDAGRSLLPYELEQSVMAFVGTLAHGGGPPRGLVDGCVVVGDVVAGGVLGGGVSGGGVSGGDAATGWGSSNATARP